MSIDEKALAIVREKWGTRVPVKIIIEAYEAARAPVPDQSVDSLEREDIEALLISYDYAKADGRPLEAIQPNIDIVRELLASTPKRESSEELPHATFNCPICGWAIPHNHDLTEEIMRKLSNVPLDSLPSSIVDDYRRTATSILSMLTSLAQFSGLKNMGELTWKTSLSQIEDREGK